VFTAAFQVQRRALPSAFLDVADYEEVMRIRETGRKAVVSAQRHPSPGVMDFIRGQTRSNRNLTSIFSEETMEQMRSAA
jgi:hypothetical protein